MAAMTVKEKQRLEAIGIVLGEGPWEYRRVDLDHARKVMLDFRADPEYAKIDGGIEIEPPRWRPGEDGFYDPWPVFRVRYQIGTAYIEGQFPAMLIYDPFFDLSVEKSIWAQFPHLKPQILPQPPVDPVDPVDPDPVDPVDPVDPDPIPIDPKDPKDRLQRAPLDPFRSGFRIDPKTYI